jgi:hypothetical protein
MNYQYLPEIMKKVEDGDYEGAIDYLILKPYHYLLFLCADIYQSANPILDLTNLSATLAKKEGIEVHRGVLLSKIESLIDEWVTGSLTNQEAYNKVAKQLLASPRCETISFCAALLMKYDQDEWNMFRLGLLTGAFVKNEN